MAKKHYVQVSFSASGWIKQDIEVTDPTMTAERMVEMLASGDAITTVHEDNDVLALPDFNTIGKVLYSETELEYFDFAAEDTYDLHDDAKPFNASKLARSGAIAEFVGDYNISTDEIMEILIKAGDDVPEILTLEEGHQDKTGKQLLREIEYFERG